MAVKCSGGALLLCGRSDASFSVSAFRITEDRKCRKGVGQRAHRCRCFIGRVVFVALSQSSSAERQWGEGAGLMCDRVGVVEFVSAVKKLLVQARSSPRLELLPSDRSATFDLGLSKKLW